MGWGDAARFPGSMHGSNADAVKVPSPWRYLQDETASHDETPDFCCAADEDIPSRDRFAGS